MKDYFKEENIFLDFEANDRNDFLSKIGNILLLNIFKIGFEKIFCDCVIFVPLYISPKISGVFVTIPKYPPTSKLSNFSEIPFNKSISSTSKSLCSSFSLILLAALLCPPPKDAHLQTQYQTRAAARQPRSDRLSAPAGSAESALHRPRPNGCRQRHAFCSRALRRPG